jgi:hypothetical protein
MDKLQAIVRSVPDMLEALYRAREILKRNNYTSTVEIVEAAISKAEAALEIDSSLDDKIFKKESE